MNQGFYSLVDFVSHYPDGICGIKLQDIYEGNLYDLNEHDGVLTFKKERSAILDGRNAAVGSANRADFEFKYVYDASSKDLRVASYQLTGVHFDWSSFVDALFDERFSIEREDDRFMLSSSLSGMLAEANDIDELHAQCMELAPGYVDSVMDDVDIPGAIDWFVQKEAGLPFHYEGQIEAPARDEIEKLVKLNLEILFRKAVEAFEADDRVEIA